MVSVVLTTYRHEAYIEQAIRSAAEQQTVFSMEILVGEDASPDGTLAVCRRLQSEFPDRIQLFAHEQNMGGHSNFNFLWTRARGKYIAWLEGDDYWTDPLKLQRQVDAMERSPESTCCFHNTWVHQNGAPHEDGFLLPGFTQEMPLPFSHLVFSNSTMTCSALYRRGLVPALPEWVWPLRIGDWPMHLMHAAQGPALFLPQPMAAYRLHPSGDWTSRPLQDRLNYTIEALEAVRLHVPQTLEQLCALSIAAFQRELQILKLEEALKARSDSLAAMREQIDHLTQIVNRAPLWRRIWRRLWRPIYRRLKSR
jgi:glycosyltransferase involved in cell wall biosynthesis